jgi:predicted secreted protein
MLRVCQQNPLRYRYVLTDSGFSAKENMAFIKIERAKDFVMVLKSNPSPGTHSFNWHLTIEYL